MKLADVNRSEYRKAQEDSTAHPMKGKLCKHYTVLGKHWHNDLDKTAERKTKYFPLNLPKKIEINETNHDTHQ